MAGNPLHVDLSAPPISREEALRRCREGDLGDLVGFRYKTEPGPTCHEGCLAPGSSPHAHSKIVGWHLIGTTGFVEYDEREYAVRASMIHAFPEG